MTNSFNCTYIDRDTQPHVKTSATQEAWSEKQARATLTLLKATTNAQANSPATMSLGRHLASHREGAGAGPAVGGRGDGGGEAMSATLLVVGCPKIASSLLRRSYCGGPFQTRGGERKRGEEDA